MDHLEDKTAFITGGCTGIGLGIAKACLEAGMRVVLGYKTEANMQRAMVQLAPAGDRIYAVSVDVTDRAAIERGAAEAVRVFGKVHVLVCNAGVVVPTPLGEASYDDWDWTLSVNLTGAFNAIRVFLPLIKAHGEGGQVLATASVLGLVANGRLGVYSAIKFAVVGMMESLRAELDGTNIGASVICPGFVMTDLWDTERNRPKEFSSTRSELRRLQSRERLAAAMKQESDWCMDPVELGRLVLRGIRANDLYILTHPEFHQLMRERCQALMHSIPSDRHPPEARVRAEAAILRNPIYAAERDRLRQMHVIRTDDEMFG